MAQPKGPHLLADIGGTNARFMVWRPGEALSEPHVLETARYPTFEAALAAFLSKERAQTALDRVAVAVAGPVVAGHAQLTNGTWTLSEATLAQATGVTGALLVNDFVALAHGLPTLRRDDVVALGPAQAADPHGVKVVLGPGTGFGVASLVQGDNGRWLALAGEGGHVDLAAGTAREAALIEALRLRHGHVSLERVLSGPGLEALYGLCAAPDAWPSPALSAAEIAVRAARGGDPAASEAIGLFTEWLGAVAGNLALTLGARGGVYIAGGIVPRWRSFFDGARFRRRFEAKGRLAAYLAGVPTSLVIADDVAFRGLASLVARP